MREQAFLRPLLFMLAGLLVWAAHFAVLYAINALACARGFANGMALGVGIVPLAISAATLLALAVLGWIVFGALSGSRPHVPASAEHQTSVFMRFVALTVAGISFVAIVYETVPAFIVPPCG